MDEQNKIWYADECGEFLKSEIWVSFTGKNNNNCTTQPT